MRTSKGKTLSVKLSGGSVPVAPEALAELSPIIPQSYYYADYQGMELEYQYMMYGAIYQRSPWVNVVIDKRAKAVARLPVEVWDVNGETETLDTRSQYAQLIANPCLEVGGLPYLPPYAFWHWLQTTIDIYGEAFLAIARDANGAPIGLMPMHPSRVAIRRNPQNGTYDYYFEAGSGINTELVHFPQQDVVPFKLYNPIHLERGLSKMEAIRQTIFDEDASRRSQNAMWKNGARPNLVLTTPNRLSDVGARRLKQAMEDAHAGSSNAGQTLVLEDGVEAKAFQVTAVDLQMIETRKMNREEIAAVYDVAPTLVGILEHATFSNITEQMRGFYRDTMAPVIEFIQSVMNTYVGSYWARNNQMKFATDEVMRGDFEMRMKAAHDGVSIAALTPNEARQLLGYNRYDDPKADKLYCNSAIQELGEPGEIMRMNVAASGVSPDGIKLDPTPGSTPVPALNGGNDKQTPKPHVIPPKAPIPVSRSQGLENKPKHYREVNAQVGRGKSPAELKAFALSLAEQYPDDLDDILKSVQMAIAARNKKEKTI